MFLSSTFLTPKFPEVKISRYFDTPPNAWYTPRQTVNTIGLTISRISINLGHSRNHPLDIPLCATSTLSQTPGSVIDFFIHPLDTLESVKSHSTLSISGHSPVLHTQRSPSAWKWRGRVGRDLSCKVQDLVKSGASCMCSHHLVR